MQTVWTHTSDPRQKTREERRASIDESSSHYPQMPLVSERLPEERLKFLELAIGDSADAWQIVEQTVSESSPS